MFKFLCRHPASALLVDKEHTVEQADAGHSLIIYHLHCIRCDSKVKIKHGRADWWKEYKKELNAT